MNVAILDARHGTGRKVENSYTVAYRNLAELRDILGADLFINPSDINMNKRYDVIICGFGSMACERELSTSFINSNPSAAVFWLVGDYEQSTFAPLFYSGRSFEAIATFGDHKIKNKLCTKQHKININALLNRAPNRPSVKKHDCIYYGRWRPDRLGYFQQYLGSSMHLCTGSKNIKMFHHNGCNPRLVKSMTWETRRETLNLFRSSLWIEDKFSHSNYTSPPNRFYESLWCNAVPLIDASCIRTLKLSGYADVDGWQWHIVKTPSEVASKCREIENGNTGVMTQWQSMAVTEKVDVVRDIRGVLEASAACSAMHKMTKAIA